MEETAVEELKQDLARCNELLRRQEEELQKLYAEVNSKTEAFQATVEILRTEKAHLEETISQLRDERDRAVTEATALRTQIENTSNDERMENEHLRERISEVAAEVARLAINLEGDNSPIEKLLAGEDARENRTSPEAGEARLSLAQRIRNMQSRAR
jgi:septal ring factor EnvC (AmiA/AmiB activator)